MRGFRHTTREVVWAETTRASVLPTALSWRCCWGWPLAPASSSPSCCGSPACSATCPTGCAAGSPPWPTSARWCSCRCRLLPAAWSSRRSAPRGSCWRPAPSACSPPPPACPCPPCTAGDRSTATSQPHCVLASTTPNDRSARPLCRHVREVGTAVDEPRRHQAVGHSASVTGGLVPPLPGCMFRSRSAGAIGGPAVGRLRPDVDAPIGHRDVTSGNFAARSAATFSPRG